jgi:hypothetical protein
MQEDERRLDEVQERLTRCQSVLQQCSAQETTLRRTMDGNTSNNNTSNARSDTVSGSAGVSRSANVMDDPPLCSQILFDNTSLTSNSSKSSNSVNTTLTNSPSSASTTSSPLSLHSNSKV